MRETALGLGLAATTAMAAAAAPAGPLDGFRDRARVLVLSAPEAGDAQLRAQRAALASVRAGVAERDLVVLEAVGSGAEARTLRERLGLPADSFRAVLIGKDGGAKITAAAPIAPQRLFATIDAMPMRRTEMRERR
ncbi:MULTISPECIES: DUF4174 domain-containing protein [Methylobacterium]|uniref:DUF4174 domain-containing protein n=1 Tax=Methylobacterium TaxID=407 RepID=UPI00073440F1|nr:MULTISPECIES: DUF4174 domain-containing protein [Methylobacterium]KTS02606.1 hypothetical protein SB3_28180 [Methylobacterium radiotolerans]KTS44398.1 hypothetical protein SB2_24495 [Methylobacterium radiotolerans]MDE3750226.1 DUF4174 domain-containing protein [Methylobacterium radiotolerans]PVZ03991.1 uncharacterized protein DUF4174 [Methylobacterium organophilum]